MKGRVSRLVVSRRWKQPRKSAKDMHAAPRMAPPGMLILMINTLGNSFEVSQHLLRVGQRPVDACVSLKMACQSYEPVIGPAGFREILRLGPLGRWLQPHWQVLRWPPASSCPLACSRRSTAIEVTPLSLCRHYQSYLFLKTGFLKGCISNPNTLSSSHWPQEHPRAG